LFNQYLQKFILLKFADCKSPLQYHFVEYWINKQVSQIHEKRQYDNGQVVSSFIAGICIAFISTKELLNHFLECLNRFANILIGNDLIDEFIKKFDEDVEGNGHFEEVLTDRIIELCFDAMKKCSTLEDFSKWTSSVLDLTLSSTRFEIGSMIAMITASSLCKNGSKNWPIESVLKFRDLLVNDLLTLSVKSIWRRFTH
jgi:hypothetical protein